MKETSSTRCSRNRFGSRCGEAKAGRPRVSALRSNVLRYSPSVGRLRVATDGDSLARKGEEGTGNGDQGDDAHDRGLVALDR